MANSKDCPGFLESVCALKSNVLCHEAQGGRRYFEITIPTLGPPSGSIYCIAVSDFMQHVLRVNPQLGWPAVCSGWRWIWSSFWCAAHGVVLIQSMIT